ncbi:RNA polymerase sigma factor [Ancylobacter oerskovii]|uniref:RNA polymerase sigma factor n=1 Tax=Ancylobacter oerskovii TaxID=459519 RepID=A0ABW4YWD2_9HYPH|nr:RNA polymerase sigma factor [Ancylobacter oerskovii]MBS7544132.1 RNA polymerase sigma factor [Ancylobacter oerskovii]
MATEFLGISDLYLNEREKLISRVRRLLQNHTTAEDIVQQAFVNLLGRETGETPSPAYVTQAARNLALNHLRDARRRAQVVVAGEDLERIADPAPSPEMATLHRGELRRLLVALAALPPRRREAFVLSRIEGLTHDEVAARMGVSRNTAITHIVAAMAELDRRL